MLLAAHASSCVAWLQAWACGCRHSTASAAPQTLDTRRCCRVGLCLITDSLSQRVDTLAKVSRMLYFLS